MMNLKQLSRQLRYDLRYAVMSYPKLYLFLTQFGDRQGILVDQDTEITIEGFPRSANTFAVNGFRLAQNRPTKIAHHKHSVSQIILSARWQIPLLVLIRNPEDAVISFVIREPLISIRSGLKYWISFHQDIWSYRDSYLLADFEDVVKDYGEIIAKVNHKFQTNFNLFEHNKENVDKCFSSMERYSQRTSGKGAVNESLIPRPSQSREQLKQSLRAELNDPKLDNLRAKANQIYQQYRQLIF